MAPALTAGNTMDGDVVLFENFEDTGMSDSAREAAAQRQPDPNRRFRAGPSFGLPVRKPHPSRLAP